MLLAVFRCDQPLDFFIVRADSRLAAETALECGAAGSLVREPIDLAGAAIHVLVSVASDERLICDGNGLGWLSVSKRAGIMRPAERAADMELGFADFEGIR